MTKQTRPPSTRKVRRDATGGKRADGHQRRRAVRRPDPTTIRKGPSDPTLTSVAGLVMFGVFLRSLGVDRALRETFASLKSRDAIYPMAAQLRMLLDLFIHAALLLKLLAHNLLRRCIDEHLPALRSWRAPWIRRAAILVPGRLLRSARRRSLRMAPRPMLN